MEQLMDNIIELENQRVGIVEQINDIRSGYLTQIDILQDEIKALQAKVTEEIDAAGLGKQMENNVTAIAQAREALVSGWSADKKVVEYNGTEFQLRVSKAPDIKDSHTLLRTIAAMPEPPIKLENIPYDKKKLVTLIEAGAIASDLAVIEEKKSLAVTFLKKD